MNTYTGDRDRDRDRDRDKSWENTQKMNGGSHGANGGHGGPAKSNGHMDSRGTIAGDSHVRGNGQIRPIHGRKESNPLAPPFIVSAPGKTIVYGEHAVVHGRAAMAAAISLRSYLLCTTLSKSKRTVTLNFADIGLKHTW